MAHSENQKRKSPALTFLMPGFKRLPITSPLLFTGSGLLYL
jgi:hypothetical protein